MPGTFFLYPTQKDAVRVRSRGYLPHWEVDNGIYSLTYRLADSLPAHVVTRLQEERRTIRKQVSGGHKPDAVERGEIDRLFGYRLDAELDRGFGECYLRIPTVADLVEGSLRFFDRQRYKLFAFALMPNHVHVLMRLFRGDDLSDVLKSWKGYTSNKALRIINRRPPFWQPEYFDRIVRDEKDFEETRRYVLDNPAKAGLRDWKWVWAADSSW